MTPITAPPDPKTAVLFPSGNWLLNNVTVPSQVWVCTFGPYNQMRYLERLVMGPPDTMPATSPFAVWVEKTQMAKSDNGTQTLWTPTRPVPVYTGMQIYAVWYYNAGSTPNATMHMSQDEWGWGS